MNMDEKGALALVDLGKVYEDKQQLLYSQKVNKISYIIIPDFIVPVGKRALLSNITIKQIRIFRNGNS